MTVQLRLAVPGDERVLAELNAFVQALHVHSEPSLFKPSSLDEVSAWFAGLIDNPSAQIWMAEEEGQVLGYASMIVHNREENPFCYARRYAEIDQISVRPGHRRRGIGRSLMEHILHTAHSAGIREVELSSWSFNTEAHEAFRRLGFKPRLIRFGRESSGSGE